MFAEIFILLLTLAIVFLLVTKKDTPPAQRPDSSSNDEHKSETTDQVSSSSTSSSPSTEEETLDPVAIEKARKREFLRGKALDEIITSEENYVRSLRNLVELYIQPLEEQAQQEDGWISMEEVAGIFSNVQILANFHFHFLADLKTKPILEVFLKLSDFLKMYTQYVNSYDSCLQTLSSLKNNSDLQQFLQRQRQHPQALNLDITSFLIAPVQRIPRYALLLREVIRNTDPSHPDYERLQQALAKIETIASHINEGKRDAEHRSKLLEIQHRIQGDFDSLLQPHRHLIREGLLSLKRSGFMSSEKEYQFFLFNDLLLWISASSNKFKGSLSFEKLTVDLSAEHNTEFSVVSPKESLHLVAASPAERDAWTRDIIRAVEIFTEQLTLAQNQAEEKRRQRHAHRNAMHSQITASLNELHQRSLSASSSASASASASASGSGSSLIGMARAHHMANSQNES
eukprot:TRINITY_DN4993_c0_g1_i3.p1 TRINITY_DN4993_c0_g1~~TRINITY_DN4993_c0_g1_i3.p1  ORF type:complete len:458 (+),score=111.70 TRINITY_DN4993_c0_g1_i3:96-1469(+)